MATKRQAGMESECIRHTPPVPFVKCTLVKRIDEDGVTTEKGKFTVSRCNLKRSHPKHLHCSDKNCLAVSNLKLNSAKYPWTRMVK
jgi:hypothetical protein